jgi:hypothetical protein
MSVLCVMAAQADYARRPVSVRTASGRWRKSRGRGRFLLRCDVRQKTALFYADFAVLCGKPLMGIKFY